MPEGRPSKNPANDTPIGTGPFKLAEWQKGSFIHLVATQRLWAPGKPIWNEIFYYVIPGRAQRRGGAGKRPRGHGAVSGIEFFELPRLRNCPAYISTKDRKRSRRSRCSTSTCGCRSSQDKRFRKAMMHAIDHHVFHHRQFPGFGLGHVRAGADRQHHAFYDHSRAPGENTRSIRRARSR